ncbi:MauE/DoxX family redox-associated membrane protein [Desulfogranum mediterraneum]|uniref:MauE/DoxX family redox-associated membrane protein n=1 Tax=Desulfogranum mediterraneum TaxID=160661 RepID=UPI000410D08A|nr:MauE/DoxX family redox-associated membrane protein [Desulfogranum mediterraneum]
MKSRVVWLARLARWFLAGIFLYSGVVKLTDPTAFAVVIQGYGLLPEWLIQPVALLLPLLEVILALGLLARVRGSLLLVGAMLIAFMGVLLYGIILGLDVDCGCFGAGDPEYAYKGLRLALGRDLFLLAVLLFLGWYQNRAPVKPGQTKSATALRREKQ